MIFVAALIFISNPAIAEDKICSPEVDAKIEKRIPLPNDINYFLRSSPKTQQVSFATSNGNRLLDIDNGSLTDVDGIIDPVLTPDGQVMAVPMTAIFDAKTKALKEVPTLDPQTFANIRYYLYGGHVLERTAKNPGAWNESKVTIGQLKDKGEAYVTSYMSFFGRDGSNKFKNIYKDESVTQNYQSLGVVRSGQENTHYRMLYEGDSTIMVKDYNFNEDTHKIEPAGPAQPACGKQFTGSLPMISKNGREFSVYDYNDGATKIFEINSSIGTCTQKESIPTLVGKVDFSPDGKKLAFHIDESESLNAMFDKPGKENKFGVFVFDRTHKTLIPVQDKSGEDSYYPVFLDNDRIAFVSAKKDEQEHQSFFINVAKISDLQGNPCPGCKTNSREGQLAAVIGSLYNDYCKAGNASFRSGFASFTRLSHERCHSFVDGLETFKIDSLIASLTSPMNAQNGNAQQFWNAELLRHATKAELLKLCDGEDNSETAPDSAPAVQ